MRGNGNGVVTLIEKLYFMMIPTSGGRTKYIYKNQHKFKSVGKALFYQPRSFPTDPEYISFGDNVNIASDVEFVNHDIVHKLLNDKYSTKDFRGGTGVLK